MFTLLPRLLTSRTVAAAEQVVPSGTNYDKMASWHIHGFCRQVWLSDNEFIRDNNLAYVKPAVIRDVKRTRSLAVARMADRTAP